MHLVSGNHEVAASGALLRKPIDGCDEIWNDAGLSRQRAKKSIRYSASLFMRVKSTEYPPHLSN